jgi:hypothetical protein
VNIATLVTWNSQDRILKHTHHVGHRIGHLNARHRDVANVLEDRRQNDISDILKQMPLESNIAIGVTAKVIEKFLQSSAECPILRVLIELIADESKLIKDPIGMILVAVTQQVTTVVVQSVPFLLAVILHDVALFLQGFPARVRTMRIVYLASGTYLMKVFMFLNQPLSSGSLSASR